MTSTLALVVIDLQLALVTGAYRERELLHTVNGLIARARSNGVPIVFVVHNHASFEPMMRGSKGWAIHPELDKQSGDEIIEKTASDAFYETNLERYLRSHGVSCIIATGMQTEYCVDATCRSALSRNFDVILVADGHTTGPSHLSAEQIIGHHNAVLANLVHPRANLRVVEAAELSFDKPDPVN